MPKMKSKSGASKRFRITGTGRIKHRRANRAHILTKKASKRKLALRSMAIVDKSDEKAIKRMLLLR